MQGLTLLGETGIVTHKCGHAVVNLLRFRGENCEDVVNRASDKFDRRYRAVEAKLAAEGKTVDDTPMDRLDELWNEVKAEEKKN